MEFKKSTHKNTMGSCERAWKNKSVSEWVDVPVRFGLELIEQKCPNVFGFKEEKNIQLAQ